MFIKFEDCNFWKKKSCFSPPKNAPQNNIFAFLTFFDLFRPLYDRFLFFFFCLRIMYHHLGNVKLSSWRQKEINVIYKQNAVTRYLRWRIIVGHLNTFCLLHPMACPTTYFRLNIYINIAHNILCVQLLESKKMFPLPQKSAPQDYKFAFLTVLDTFCPLNHHFSIMNYVLGSIFNHCSK